MIIKFYMIAILILCFVLPLNATTLIVDDGFDGNYFDITYYNKDKKTSGAGKLSVQLQNSTEWLPAFCVDLGTKLYSGENYFEIFKSPSNYLSNGKYVEWIMNYALSLPEVKDEKDYAGAGLQLAIWEVLYDFDSFSLDGKYNLSNDEDNGGNFFYNPSSYYLDTTDTDTYYDKYIAALISQMQTPGSIPNSSGKYVVADLYKNKNGVNVNGQDIIIAVVPEPTTLMLLSFGLLGLSAFGRRKNS